MEDVKKKCDLFNLLLASGRQMVNPVIGSVARFLSQSELLNLSINNIIMDWLVSYTLLFFRV